MRNRAVVWAPLALVAVIVASAAILTAAPEGLEADLLALGDEDSDAREAVVLRLSEGNAEIVTALLDEVDGDHSTLAKGSIVKVVRKHGLRTKHAGALGRLLKSQDAETRGTALQIAAVRPSLVRNELLAVADDPDEATFLRSAAASALGGVGSETQQELTRLSTDQRLPQMLRRAAMRGLARCGTGGAKTLASMVSDEGRDLGERESAMIALRDERAQSETELPALVTAKWAWVREHALHGLARRGVSDELEAVAGRFIDISADVRLAALQAVIHLGFENGKRTQIAGLLADADPRVAIFACQSVARSSKSVAKKVKNPLVLLLANGNFRVRYEAALALDALGDKSGAATMRADKNAAVNQNQTKLATSALVSITGSAK